MTGRGPNISGRAVAVTGRGFDITDLQPTIVDDFEDGDLSEYPFNQGGDWGIVSNGVNNSNFRLQRTGTESGQSGPQIFSVPGDGLPAYPSKGDTIQYYFQDKTGAQPAFDWAVQNSNEENPGEYRLLAGNKKNVFSLRYTDSTDEAVLDEVSFTYNQDFWYRVVIEWGDTVTCTLFDGSTQQAQVSAAEPDNYESGFEGIGFSDNGPVTTNSCTFDSVELI